ncbi:MAG: DUF3311 domain-containing protein [Pirellulaceae bacterium]|nr:DUF3311 domain-containing protein [Pirellulaceae bacterium]
MAIGRDEGNTPHFHYILSFPSELMNGNPATYAIWLAVLLMIGLHQDVWNWDNDRLVFGFMPVALFYHACFSVAAGILWFLATVVAWPEELEALDAEADRNSGMAEVGTEGGKES